MNNLEVENQITNDVSIENKQRNFLQTNIGKAVNTGLNIGLRYILPDVIEDQVIEIKDSFLQNGFKEGIQTAIDSAINFGKSALGIVTGNFENITQMQNAVKTGGIIDGISDLLDVVVDKIRKEGLINNAGARTIKQGKDIILNNIENNIDKMFVEQSQAIEYTDKYINNWKKYFDNKNFSGMEKEYKKIEKNLEKLIPIENTINEAKKIEILHNLIKNNGQNFNLSKEQLELVEKLK